MFPFFRHVQVSSCEICRWKYLYSSFSSQFFLVIVFLFIFVLSVLFLAVVISFSLFFFNIVFKVSCWCIHSIFNTSKSSSYFFLDSNSLSLLYLGCKDLCIVIHFLALWLISWSSCFVHFKYYPDYLTRRTARCLSLKWDPFCRAWFRDAFSIFWDILKNFHVCLFDGVHSQYCQVPAIFLFSERSSSFFIWKFSSFCYLSVPLLMGMAYFPMSKSWRYIPIVFIRVFNSSSFFLQLTWCRPCTLRNWSFLVIY